MKVYTKVVWQWVGDTLRCIEKQGYDYDGPVDLLKSGGSSGQQNYQNLDKLYGIQADQAEYLGGMFKNTVAPAYSGWLSDAQGYGSTANQEQQAERAGKASSGATSQQMQALQDNMSSMGIDPSDARFAQTMKEASVQGAGQQAAAETTARDNVRNQGFARVQDAIGMGMGTPTQASQAANSAANTANIGINNQNMQQQQQANNVSNIVRGGLNVWGAYGNGGGNGVTFAADGGEVLRLKRGGYVQKMAKGGLMGANSGGGFMASPQIQAPPPMAGGQQAPSPVAAGASAATTPLGINAMRQGVGKVAEMGGNAAGSPGVSAFGRGLQMSPGQANTAAQAYQNSARQMAEHQVDQALGTSPGEADMALANSQVGAAGATPGADALAAEGIMGEGAGVGADAAAAAGTDALAASAGDAALTAGIGEAGMGLAAAGTLGAAIPVIGAGVAGYGIGKAAGWWADGGQITPGSQQQTGPVSGPGGPKDDEVPAMLSHGEFVMPVGAVKYFGLDRLEKMRAKGLEHEKQMGIH